MHDKWKRATNKQTNSTQITQHIATYVTVFTGQSLPTLLDVFDETGAVDTLREDNFLFLSKSLNVVNQ